MYMYVCMYVYIEYIFIHAYIHAYISLVRKEEAGESERSETSPMSAQA